MDDRGCRGRMAHKHRPVLLVISIPPSGSLATSFTKPIPSWDEMGQCEHCCYVSNQHSKKAGAAIMTSTQWSGCHEWMSIVMFVFVSESETSKKKRPTENKLQLKSRLDHLSLRFYTMT